jgi:tRNA(Ile)-lysidine synthase
VTPALLAVRKAVADAVDGPAVIACSGGADSLALAAAAAMLRWPMRAAVIDHGLQVGSADVAAAAAEQCRGLGLQVTVRRVRVDGPGGPEAAAREARYAALREIADGQPILLAHTLDDQAETVLLRLARGSGARSLQAMAPAERDLLRPLLGLRRGVVRQACRDAGLEPHEDPHNTDDQFARVRVRRHGLPALVEDLGEPVVLGLARSAQLLREDNAALDQWASHVHTDDVEVLQTLPQAVLTRVIRRLALEAGAPAAALTREHLTAVSSLITRWRGQGPIHLPGGIRAGRESGRLVLHTTAGRVDAH